MEERRKAGRKGGREGGRQGGREAKTEFADEDVSVGQKRAARQSSKITRELPTTERKKSKFPPPLQKFPCHAHLPYPYLFASILSASLPPLPPSLPRMNAETQCKDMSMDVSKKGLEEEEEEEGGTLPLNERARSLLPFQAFPEQPRTYIPLPRPQHPSLPPPLLTFIAPSQAAKRRANDHGPTS
jgi:hypothetical protein